MAMHLTSAFSKSGRPHYTTDLVGVFKFLHSGDRFRKAPFSVTENAVSVWTVGHSLESIVPRKTVASSVLVIEQVKVKLLCPTEFTSHLQI